MRQRILGCLLAAAILLAALSGCTEAPDDASPSPSLSPDITQGRDVDYFKNMAVSAVDDVIKNWWDGDAAAGTGHIKFANQGFHKEGMTVANTCPWETSMIYACIYDMWFLTGSEYYKTCFWRRPQSIGRWMKKRWNLPAATTTGPSMTAPGTLSCTCPSII